MATKVVPKFKTGLKKTTQSAVINTANKLKTVIDAQLASAGPPLGPLIGAYGLNIGNFCKSFNEKTKTIKQGIPLPVTVHIKPDRTYEIDIHTPSIVFYLMQAAGIQVGKARNGPTWVGKTTIKHVYEIAKIKHSDPHSRDQLFSLEEVVKHTVNIARSCGILVVRDLDPEEYQIFLAERLQYLKELEEAREEERKAKLLRSGKP